MNVLVHGGAGGAPDDPEPRQAILDEAAETAATASTPLDAVEEAVRRLESSPRFNAGVGSAVQSDGGIRTDAGIMTDDRSVGAACSMQDVEHAVSVARAVMAETPHVLVSGEQAVSLADAFGIETGVDLWSSRTREKWADLEPPSGGPAAQLSWLADHFGGTDPDGRDHDTVGAVATDGAAIAAATSTGGRWLALAGRVGDVPQVGSGFYCCPVAGVSATGAGEDIARVTLSARVARYIEDGESPDEATARAITEFEELTGSTAGVIAIDADGRIGSAYNSEGMQTAVASRPV